MNKLTLESAVDRSEIETEVLSKSDTELTDSKLAFIEGFKVGYNLRDSEDTLNLLPQDDDTLNITALSYNNIYKGSL